METGCFFFILALSFERSSSCFIALEKKSLNLKKKKIFSKKVYLSNRSQNQSSYGRAGQQSRVFSAFAEALGWVPNITTVAHTCAKMLKLQF